MKLKKVIFSIAPLLIIGFTGLQAQESVTASGGDATGNGGSVSYSVGQVVYTTNVGANGYSSQGVQQPYEISELTGIEQAKDISLSCIAYPNPTSDILTLRIKGKVQTQYIASLYDMNGKLIENIIITGNETTISMENHVPATYFLKVISNQKEVKTFKIIKK